MGISFLMMFYTTISMSLKLKEKNQVVPSFESLMDDDSIVINELSLLACNIGREVINMLDYLFIFKRKYDNRKAHNMVSLITMKVHGGGN
jgi:hypothetical protein